MTLALNLLIIAALIVVAPLALAMLLITATAVGTTVTQARSRRRMMRGLDDLIVSPLPIELCLRDRPRIHRNAPRCGCCLLAGHTGLHSCGHPTHGGWA